MLNDLKFDKQADLYNNILYTVVPRDMSLEFGVYPQDQKFHSSYVFLWDTYADLNNFDEEKWKKLRIIIPQEAKNNHTLTRITGSTVGVEYIPNSWPMEEQKINSLYNE